MTETPRSIIDQIQNDETLSIDEKHLVSSLQGIDQWNNVKIQQNIYDKFSNANKELMLSKISKNRDGLKNAMNYFDSSKLSLSLEEKKEYIPSS